MTRDNRTTDRRSAGHLDGGARHPLVEHQGEALADVGGVQVVHWNPPAWTRRRPDHWVRRRRMDNFGDLLGPLIVRRLLDARGDGDRQDGDARLLAVGSILQLGRDGDVVWGSGVNGYHLDDLHPFSSLDVRAVRGPVTRRFLAAMGIDAPEVYGDPALLLPVAYPEVLEWATPKRHEVTVVPNLWEVAHYRKVHGSLVLSPRLPLDAVLHRIAASELVVGYSLHALVVAESLGIPARLVCPLEDPLVKYEDYYLGTGREVAPAETVTEAMHLGGQLPPSWSPGSLLEAFPADLWTGDRRFADVRLESVATGG